MDRYLVGLSGELSRNRTCAQQREETVNSFLLLKIGHLQTKLVTY